MPSNEKEKPKPPSGPDDDVVGKVYDGALMRRLLTWLRPYKLQVGLSVCCILLKSGLIISGPFFVKVAIDRYMSSVPNPHPGWLATHLSQNPSTGITQLGILYLLALTFTFLLELGQTYLMQWTGQKIMFDLRREIFRHIQTQDVVFFDRNPVGRLVTRVTSDVDALNEMFTSGVLDIFENSITLVFIVVFMLQMSWPLAIITLLVIPAIIFVTGIFRRSVRISYRSQRAATAKINAFTQEYVSGMSIVQLFNREQRAFNDFSAVNDENKQAWARAIFAYSLYYPIVEFLSSFAIALVIWIGGAAILHNLGIAVPRGIFSTVTVGVLVAFIQYAQRFFRPIQELSDKFNILQAAMAAAERVFKLLDQFPQIISPTKTIAPDPLSPQYGQIEFRNVWFTYQKLSDIQEAIIHTDSPTDLRDTSDADGLKIFREDIEWILRDVSFTIHPNETAAIVGHTGAGKTTITALMMRFYDIQAGQILVDGIDIREQDLNALRKRFGVVLQDPFLFSGTIADNIRLGTASITDQRLEEACEEVNVADFIRTLPARLRRTRP